MRTFGVRAANPAVVELDAICRNAPGAPKSVLFFSPKGGAAKTTTTAAVSKVLAEKIAGMLLAIAWNPDAGNLTTKVGLTAPAVPARLLTLPQYAPGIRYPTDLAPWLDRVGRVHLLHNDGVPNIEVGRLTLDDYRTIMDIAQRFATLTLLDGGVSTVHPSFLEAMARVDHLVLTLIADPSVIDMTIKVLNELDRLGHGSLLARATVSMTVTDPRVNQDIYGKGVRYFERRGCKVQVVPYDRAAASRARELNLGRVKSQTLAAYTNLALYIAQAIFPTAPEYIAEGSGPYPTQEWPEPAVQVENPGAPLIPVGYEQAAIQPAPPPQGTVVVPFPGPVQAEQSETELPTWLTRSAGLQ